MSNFTNPAILETPPVAIIRHGKYMHTSNGKKFWPLNPVAEEVHIEVIAHHLATQGRYNGATRHPEIKDRIFYSVAEHCVYVAHHMEFELQRPDLALEALLHDASEAYIGDLIRPLKYSDEFAEPFKTAERRVEKVIADRFNLVYPFPKEVHTCDEAVTAAEVEQIIEVDKNDEWVSGMLHDDRNVAPINIEMIQPYEAMQGFLGAYHRLMYHRSKYRAVPTSLAL